MLRPHRPPEEWGLVPLLAASEVARELRREGLAATVKWPNDILLGGKKVGGILVETRWGAAPFAVVGVGLNVARVPDVPEATALVAHSGPPPEPRALAERLVAALVARTLRWEREGRGPLLDEIRASCSTLGQKVGWEDGEGIAIDISDDGALVIEAGGARRRVMAGDVRVKLPLR